VSPWWLPDGAAGRTGEGEVLASTAEPVDPSEGGCSECDEKAVSKFEAALEAVVAGEAQRRPEAATRAYTPSRRRQRRRNRG